jgi:hypothetical protein
VPSAVRRMLAAGSKLLADFMSMLAKPSGL